MKFINHNLPKAILSVLTISITSHLYAADIDSINKLNFTELLNQHSLLNTNDFEQVRNNLWEKYLKEAQSLTDTKSEFDNRALKFQNKTMRFSLDVIGAKPKDGYPLYIALHGGGQTDSDMNDDQWEAMQVYYKDSVDNGIYVAPRGISNSWKLHSEDESYPLYDKLIEEAILFAGVNPDRVYLMGFSAGGDGVYQITPRMPARFAAVNMSAGHHNWISFDNLHNTPILLQVGELDAAYKRNTVAVENSVAMSKLHEQYASGYTHDVFVHYNGTHNGWKDNDSKRRNQTVIADPVAWLNGNRATKTVNSNAMDWMNQYSRDAIPNKLVWDLSVDAKLRTYQTGAALLSQQGYSSNDLAKPATLFYWLDVSQSNAYPDKGKIVVEVNKSTNTIIVSEISNIDKLKILLRPELIDLNKPVQVEITGKVIGSINVKQDISIMTRTMLERSDVSEIYDAEINLALDKDANTWTIVT